MKIENHILNILQLYEYAMSVGRTLDSKENCDTFLKLLLKRKDLNACWILSQRDGNLELMYSLPVGKKVKVSTNKLLKQWLDSSQISVLVDAQHISPEISPIKLHGGQVGIFKLKDEGYLFLYSKSMNLNNTELTQLQPVIDKFSNNLRACKAFEEQNMLLENLKAQNQELSDYAHMISHDLKSPLRTIETLTYWMKEENRESLNKNAKDQLDMISDNVSKLDNLINGILNYSSIGKEKTEVHRVVLGSLINDIMKMIKIPDHFNIVISDMPIINGNKHLLQQLFQNLIINAVKYNDKDEPMIKIDSKVKSDHYEFSVQDNGIGIKETYFERIFNTFEKLEDATNSTGLGLSIVKKIVQVYDGDIWLTSELGEGTTFYFTLRSK
jgi:signal transduction histidine kinase